MYMYVSNYNEFYSQQQLENSDVGLNTEKCLSRTRTNTTHKGFSKLILWLLPPISEQTEITDIS